MITGSLIHDTVGRTLASFSSRGFGILPRPMLGSCLFQPIDVHDLSRLIVSFILTPLPLCALPHVCDVGGPEPIGFFQYFNSAAEIFNFRLIVLPLPFFVLLPTLKFLGSFGFNLFSSLHEKLYRLQEVKVVSNNIHPLIDFAPSPYWSSLARLRNDYFLRRLIS